jgi:hypothetical protein
MQSDFMSRVPDERALFGERLERVAGDEPRRLDVIFVEELEQTLGAHRTREETCVSKVRSGHGALEYEEATSADVARRVFAAVGAQPAGYGIDVDAIAAENSFLAHGGRGCGGQGDDSGMRWRGGEGWEAEASVRAQEIRAERERCSGLGNA